MGCNARGVRNNNVRHIFCGVLFAAMKLKFHPTLTYTKDTGLVAVIALLVAAYFTENLLFVLIALGTIIVVVTIPVILTPLAVIWYYFTATLGKVTNRILLSVIFVGLVTPVAIIRRCLRYDPMKKKGWKKGVNSVFEVRNHTFTPDDLNRPY